MAPLITSAIHIRRIRIDVGRMALLVAIDNSVPVRTSPKIAATVLAAYPRIALHSCINSKGPTFSAVAEDTWLAHLLEHVIIDRQIAIIEEECAGHLSAMSATLVGTTEKIGEREFKVEISFIDDLIALRALNSAIGILDSAVEADRTVEPPNSIVEGESYC